MMRRTSSSNQPRALRVAPRRAAVLVAALVCLAVVGVAGASVVRSALSQHRSSLQHERRLQALWLAESAIAHFKAQSAEPREQTWTPPGGAGVVRLRVVSDDADDSSPRRVVVEAHWPDESPESVVHRREFSLSR